MTPPLASGRGPAVEGVREAAVVDVGSNSVRLVVYRIDGRALVPVFNEKVTAQLGRGLSNTGALWAPGADAAIRTLQRFAAITKEMGVADIHVVATAAVREASDGQAFAARALAETGFRLRVLSVEDEARLSALGVAAGAPAPHGVVGDLGGLSLELMEVSARGGLGRGESFALGHLALGALGPFDYERTAAIAEEELSRSKVLPGAGGAFYAVGGAWRAIGRIDIALSNHPIGVLHQHDMSRAEVLKVIDLTRRQSPRSLERLEEAAAKRADSLPFAAVVLERVMRAGGFERVLISAYGLREGVLVEAMDARALALDPLLAGADALAGHDPRMRALGAALAAWIEPVMARQPAVFSPDRDPILRAAAARLADIGGALHPDQRIEVMFDLVLRAQLSALSHAERAFLAAAVHHRYTRAAPKHAEGAFERLVSEDGKRAAAALGALLRLGATAAGRSAELLSRFALSADARELTLTVKAGGAHLMTDQISRRLDNAAAALRLAAAVRYE